MFLKKQEWFLKDFWYHHPGCACLFSCVVAFTIRYSLLSSHSICAILIVQSNLLILGFAILSFVSLLFCTSMKVGIFCSIVIWVLSLPLTIIILYCKHKVFSSFKNNFIFQNRKTLMEQEIYKVKENVSRGWCLLLIENMQIY